MRPDLGVIVVSVVLELSLFSAHPFRKGEFRLIMGQSSAADAKLRGETKRKKRDMEVSA